MEELVMDEEWAGRNGRGEEDLANAADAHEEEEESWEDWQAGEGEDEDATKSLFDNTVLPSVEAALEYDARTHGFDLPRLRSEVTCASCIIQCAHATVLHTSALLQDVTTAAWVDGGCLSVSSAGAEGLAGVRRYRLHQLHTRRGGRRARPAAGGGARRAGRACALVGGALFKTRPAERPAACLRLGG